jgi:hypothetical protein
MSRYAIAYHRRSTLYHHLCVAIVEAENPTLALGLLMHKLGDHSSEQKHSYETPSQVEDKASDAEIVHKERVRYQIAAHERYQEVHQREMRSKSIKIKDSFIKKVWRWIYRILICVFIVGIATLLDLPNGSWIDDTTVKMIVIAGILGWMGFFIDSSKTTK